jgi:paraquat-inducible protein B
MSTESEFTAPRRRSSLLWILALVAALAIGLVVGWLAFDGEGTETTVSAETEQEINALIDDWLTAWNTGDG